MLDEPFRRWMARSAAAPADWLARAGVTPNAVTVAAGGLGVAAAAVVATGRLRSGAALWLLGRILDGYDGLLARRTGQGSLFGGYLDITLDMLAYSAMAVGFAVAMPALRLWWFAVLVGYVMAITSTLALSSLLERADRTLGGNRSLEFTPGLAEGGETTIVYVALALFPAGSAPMLVLWVTVLGATFVQRTALASRLLR